MSGRTDGQASRTTALSLNEDNSHFFFTRAGQDLSEDLVDRWVDQYAGTQVRELLLCPNSMRTSYASEVWDPIWRGYDPAGPDDQPLLASLPPASRAGARGWIHTAWALDQAGIDVYARWIRRARERGLVAVALGAHERRAQRGRRALLHPRRALEVPARSEARGIPLPPLDRPRLRLRPARGARAPPRADPRASAERYDPDGIELDWMRFGFHFRPGFEGEGAAVLTDFTSGGAEDPGCGGA